MTAIGPGTGAEPLGTLATIATDTPRFAGGGGCTTGSTDGGGGGNLRALASRHHSRRFRAGAQPFVEKTNCPRVVRLSVGRRIANCRQAEAAEVARAAEHVQHDAGLARVVEVQSMVADDVEEVVR